MVFFSGWPVGLFRFVVRFGDFFGGPLVDFAAALPGAAASDERPPLALPGCSRRWASLLGVLLEPSQQLVETPDVRDLQLGVLSF